MTLKGVFCITKYGGETSSDVTEPCGVKCKPGMIPIKVNFNCKEVTKKFQVFTLKDCVSACMKDENCTLMAFKMEGPCNMCKGKDPGEFSYEYDLYSYYDKNSMKECVLPQGVQKDDKIDVTGCIGKMSELECSIVCKDNHKGNIKVTCGRTGIFKLEHDCEKTCYLEKKEATDKFDMSNCQSSKHNMIKEKDCKIKCKSRLGTATVTCPKPGGKFVLSDQCKVETCKIDEKHDKKRLENVTLDGCDTKSKKLRVDECDLKCKKDFEGNVTAYCNLSFIFDFKINCTKKNDSKDKKSK